MRKLFGLSSMSNVPQILVRGKAQAAMLDSHLINITARNCVIHIQQ